MSSKSYTFQRFVLLCHQRSGSNALASLLKQHPEVRTYGQLFNNGLMYRRLHRAELDLPLFRAHPETAKHYGTALPLKKRLELFALRFVPRAHHLDAYMDAFWDRFEGDDSLGAVGFKIHDFQLPETDLLRLCTHHVDRIVLLSRDNLLQAAVSWAVALQTEVWVRTEKAKPLPRVTLDPDQVAWFIDKTQSNVEAWRHMLQRVDTPSLHISFEGDVLPRRIAPLFRFIGVDSTFEASFRTKRLSKRTYDHVRNAEDLNERLGNPSHGYLFPPANQT